MVSEDENFEPLDHVTFAGLRTISDIAGIGRFFVLELIFQQKNLYEFLAFFLAPNKS